MSELEKIDSEILEAEEALKNLRQRRDGILRAAIAIETELSDLDARWNYLDHQGVHGDKQREIADKIASLRDSLKAITGQESRY